MSFLKVPSLQPSPSSPGAHLSSTLDSPHLARRTLTSTTHRPFCAGSRYRPGGSALIRLKSLPHGRPRTSPTAPDTPKQTEIHRKTSSQAGREATNRETARSYRSAPTLAEFNRNDRPPSIASSVQTRRNRQGGGQRTSRMFRVSTVGVCSSGSVVS